MQRRASSKARVIDEISSIAFAEPSEAISVSEKLNALALLSKVLGLMVNRQEISGPGGAPVQLDVDASSARARIESRLNDMASRLPSARVREPAQRLVLEVLDQRCSIWTSRRQENCHQGQCLQCN